MKRKRDIAIMMYLTLLTPSTCSKFSFVFSILSIVNIAIGCIISAVCNRTQTVLFQAVCRSQSIHCSPTQVIYAEMAIIFEWPFSLKKHPYKLKQLQHHQNLSSVFGINNKTEMFFKKCLIIK
jgi:hypothetical protein